MYIKLSDLFEIFLFLNNIIEIKSRFLSLSFSVSLCLSPFSLTACTAEHYFRIDRAQEHLHYICDIAIDELYILDHEAATMPQTPDQERSFSAYSQRIGAQNERRNMDQQGRSGSTGTQLPYISKRMFCNYYYRKKRFEL